MALIIFIQVQTAPAVLDIIDTLQKDHPQHTLRLEWIPGHMSIDGNEKADQAAKSAALQGTQSNPNHLRCLKSARNNSIRQTIATEWLTEQHNGQDNACQLRNIIKRPNTKPSLNAYQMLGDKRKHIAWIARLRTGHCSLNKYLNRINVVDTPICDCGEGVETVKHYLLVCGNYEEARDKLRRRVGAQGMRLEILLWDTNYIKDTIKFIEETERFDF